ncbi:uncharacterized protein LOC127245197 [Andrographis paniculata]|uniref:uncharacterized protein LOC127245197 n=1 Tax=Andrographis paniculata TaxID=175694 RepID=UPI0021E957AB|nr:uncharacterized protein LOC127245197 [Andrographis paniculata]
MCRGRFRNGEEPKSIPIPRRSPRFANGRLACVVNAYNLKPSPRKTQSQGRKTSKKEGKTVESKSLIKSSGKSRMTSRSKGGARFNASEMQNPCVVERRVTRSTIRGIGSSNSGDNVCPRRETRSNNSTKSKANSRRPERLRGGACPGNAEIFQDLKQQQCVIEKRVTRSSIRGNNLIGEFDSSDSVRASPNATDALVSGDFCKQERGDSIIEPRVTRFSNRRKSTPLIRNDFNIQECGSAEEENVDTESKNKGKVGEKRKRCEDEDKRDTAAKWTEEQELALQRGYFTIKPTPHFWKKVARMVPGKSAEECFNKIHSDHLTPSQQHRIRSRVKKTKPLSPVLFSASKVLCPPAETKAKKNKCSQRRKKLRAQKTVRQLLHKQQKEDKNHKADFFAVLEDTSPLDFKYSSVFASPSEKGSGILARCQERSSSASKKQQSRINGAQKSAFLSPPVLKQIKNRALHEKYIDQLHTRDAKRKAESLRNSKCSRGNDDSDSKLKSIKSAKDMLIFNAQDAFNCLRRLPESTDDDDDDDDDNDGVSCEEDEDEDDLS